MASNSGYPAFYVGQRWTATLAQSTLPRTAWKTTSLTRTSTASATADPDLVLPVEANALYILNYVLQYTTTAAADIRWTFTGPSGMTGSHVISGLQVGGAGTSTTEDNSVRYDIGATAGAGGLGSGSPFGVIGSGMVDTAGTAGNFTLAWAQFTSTAVNTTLEANSYIQLLRVE